MEDPKVQVYLTNDSSYSYREFVLGNLTVYSSYIFYLKYATKYFIGNSTQLFVRRTLEAGEECFIFIGSFVTEYSEAHSVN